MCLCVDLSRYPSVGLSYSHIIYMRFEQMIHYFTGIQLWHEHVFRIFTYSVRKFSGDWRIPINKMLKCRALAFPSLLTLSFCWINSRVAGDLRRHHNTDVTSLWWQTQHNFDLCRVYQTYVKIRKSCNICPLRRENKKPLPNWCLKVS